MKHGRKKQYTEIGLRRLPCARCGDPAYSQWQTCADGNLWRPICKKCDIKLNLLVLVFMGDPEIDEKMEAYRKELILNTRRL